MVAVGESDRRIEVYTFRLCMTDSPGHRVPLTKPDGYNASEWEFWRRLYKNGEKPPADLKGSGGGLVLKFSRRLLYSETRFSLRPRLSWAY